MTSSNRNTYRVIGLLWGEFHSQRPVTRRFDVFFDLRLNNRLSNQSRRWCFETLSRSLWRHCNRYCWYNIYMLWKKFQWIITLNNKQIVVNQGFSSFFIYYRPKFWVFLGKLIMFPTALAKKKLNTWIQQNKFLEMEILKKFLCWLLPEILIDNTPWTYWKKVNAVAVRAQRTCQLLSGPYDRSFYKQSYFVIWILTNCDILTHFERLS